jgi:ATP-binding cassette subfamily B protein
MAVALLFVQAITDLALPDYMSDIINDGVAAGNIGKIAQIGIKMLGITLLGAVCSILVGYLAAKIAAGVSRKLRYDVFDKVQHFSNKEFDEYSTASLITRTTNDITQIQMVLIMIVRLVFYAPIMAVGGVTRALSKSTSMSWIIALAMIVLFGLIICIFSITMPKMKLVQKLVDRLNLVSRENLEGMLVIRAFNTQQFEEQRFDKANSDLTATNLFVNRMMVLMMPAMMLIMNLLQVTIVWVGAHEVTSFNLDVGDMMAYMQYAMQIIMAFLMMSMMFIMIPRASVSADRINEVLTTQNSIVDKETPKCFPSDFIPTVEFRDVSFKYPGSGEYSLRHISFTAKPGQTTAFIGSTGSGKTTVVSLVPRFYEATEGEILISGVNINDVSQKELRDKLGYVQQKSILFSGTIDSNLHYANDDATAEDIDRAAEIAQASEFISSKPDGYDTAIAQGGGNVSGGQKQRLAIARALVKNAPINIFDDSFSALDVKTDAKLRKAIKEKLADTTTLLVAQRISTVLDAEQIVVLDNGRMVGCGTHDELMKTCEIYQDIARSQLSEEELAK